MRGEISVLQSHDKFRPAGAWEGRPRYYFILVEMSTSYDMKVNVKVVSYKSAWSPR